ncbi:MAG: hypothetical protein BECKG1743D_GA0114223_100843 [Candidatus Kentron sp. G]|nr:MAG: hypothetical protein BECKG1743F_GA0114225_100733 [Candidatus Kentron sp. G]VFM98790.1 MAG: hypothetical protein BECKG1743D_GA0114223_100843 [Candidatus Kentron sp. G]
MATELTENTENTEKIRFFRVFREFRGHSFFFFFFFVFLRVLRGSLLSLVAVCRAMSFVDQDLFLHGLVDFIFGFGLPAPRVTSQPRYSDSDATWASMAPGAMPASFAAFLMCFRGISSRGSK